MNTSIIISLLIALVIICATTIVNNLINKEYKNLKDKWRNRTNVLSDLVFEIGKLEENIYKLGDIKNMDEELKASLFNSLTAISSMKASVRSYERESF